MRMREAEQWVKRLTYKPGWRITAEIDTHHHILHIIATHYGPSVDDPLGLPVKIQNRTSIHASELEQMSDPSHLMPLILSDLIRRTELDLVDEWLRIDGKQLKSSRV